MSTTLDYLIQDVRVKIGDFSVPYRYIDAWVLAALNLAAKNFQRYSKSKYTVDLDNVISRNSNTALFSTVEDSEGTVERRDESVIILMAAIIMLEGSLENSAWNTVSWKDAEISFSNLESGRIRNNILDKLTNELNDLILPPTKRLATPGKQSLHGYKTNSFESEGEY